MANKAASPGYWGFMENTVGLGTNGTHAAHATVAGGATWAVGRYGGVEAISSRWWAPFAGAFTGLGLSITARYLMVDDDVRMAILEQKIKKDLKKVKLTDEQRESLADLMTEMKVLEDQSGSGEKPETKKGSARKRASGGN